MKIAKMLSKCDSSKQFYDAIPTNLVENIRFRIDLHKFLSTDLRAQQVYLNLCRDYIPIFFSTTAWTLNPWDRINSPFILRPAQIPAVETLNWCIDNGHDAGINKSREEGASEICCKLFAAKILLHEFVNFIVGSRVKSLVDNYGDYYSLYAKIDNVFECLPSWWKKLCGYDPKNNRKDMLLTVPANSSSIIGETTNESFSAGSRATAVLLDEFGRVDYSVAESIEGSVHDVSPCIIYSSTHWLGKKHTFNKCLEKNTTKLVELLWYKNPVKMGGLYETSSIGSYKIIDEDYYKDKDLNSAIILENISDYDPDKDRIQIIADGLKGVHSPYRAPWFDFQQSKRMGNRRDFICNVCATPLGASDSPFDQDVLNKIKQTTIRPPDMEGEVLFSLSPEGFIDEEEINFYPGHGERRLKWWGKLRYGRPDQRHNYIIGVDPSYGLGSANSAAVIMDVNTHEQVGSWVDSTTKPEDFADMMVALSYWIGGVSPTFLIWESNAGCGVTFGQRIAHQGYHWVYTQKREDSKTRKKTQKWGWASNEKSKENLLGEFGVALSGGLSGDDTYLSFIIRDENLLDELFDYVFKEKGKGIIQSSKADLSTGAAERHGDRGIAAGLCVLACKEQMKGDFEFSALIPVNSFKYYMEQEKRKQEDARRNKRRFLF